MIKEKFVIWKKISTGIGNFFSTHFRFSSIFYTLLSIVSAVIAVISAYFHCYILTIGMFFFAASCDVIDGAVARAQNKASNLGAFLDGVTDRFVDFAIIFSFFYFNITTIWLPIEQLICIASFVVILPSFNVAYANHRRAVDDDDETLIWRLMNRGEMFFLLMAVMISSLVNSSFAGYLLILFILLSSFTIMQTIIATIYHSKRTSTCIKIA